MQSQGSSSGSYSRVLRRCVCAIGSDLLLASTYAHFVKSCRRSTQSLNCKNGGASQQTLKSRQQRKARHLKALRARTTAATTPRARGSPKLSVPSSQQLGFTAQFTPTQHTHTQAQISMPRLISLGGARTRHQHLTYTRHHLNKPPSQPPLLLLPDGFQ